MKFNHSCLVQKSNCIGSICWVKISILIIWIPTFTMNPSLHSNDPILGPYPTQLCCLHDFGALLLNDVSQNFQRGYKNYKTIKTHDFFDWFFFIRLTFLSCVHLDI
jgi:hypothetical protein